MSLRSTTFRLNPRLQRAAQNKPSMKAFEPDHVAVELLQEALRDLGFDPALKVDGIYGQKTAAAVRAVQARFNMDRDGGAAGRQVLGILDILLQGGTLGADLAQLDAPLAARKVRSAITALDLFRTALATGTGFSQVTVEALNTHFRLAVAQPTIGVGRQVTDADIKLILEQYQNLLGLFGATRFETGVPVNGIFTAAEAPLGGPIRFGPAFTDVNSTFASGVNNRIGSASRAAILIHEGIHVFDGLSGNNATTHISEFDSRYPAQSAENSLHNPSSYASFAAHVHLGRDPSPRFGLGPGARGLDEP